MQTQSVMRQWGRVCWELGVSPWLTQGMAPRERVMRVVRVISVWAVLGNKGRGLSGTTIRGYLSRMYSYHREVGLAHPLTGCDDFPVQRALRGIDCLGSQPAHRRMPITAEMILLMLLTTACSVDSAESAMLRCAIVLAFFALFRRSDMFPATSGAFNPEFDMCVGDLAWEYIDGVRHLVITLKYSKGDRAGAGDQIVLGPGAWGLCIVEEMWAYLHRWRAGAAASEPLFVDGHGAAIGFSKYAALVAAAIGAIGEDPRAYTPHSWRIGGATAAAAAGIPEFLIQQLGRWKSLCFKIYTRRDKRLHGGAAALMASSRSLLVHDSRKESRRCTFGV